MKKTFLPLLLVFLTSCATANLTSNKASWYTKKLSKTYVIANTAKQAETFTRALCKELLFLFEDNSVESDFEIRNPLSLDSEQDVEDRINEFNPDQLILIKQTSLHSTNGLVDGGQFEISIIEKESKKVVWKGLLDVYGQFGMEMSIKQSLKKLTEKLKQDGLL